MTAEQPPLAASRSPRNPVVIAIDGPAASGKSSTAAAVAREIGAVHLDSGALYRALTAIYLDQPEASPVELLQAAERRGLGFKEVGGSLLPFLDGRNAEPLLRSGEVNARVSEVSSWPPIREWVNARLRAAASPAHPLVLDGRDIGTAVFPQAPVKIFLTASPEARARRRLLQRGSPADPAAVAGEAARLVERDAQDSARPVAPLRPAADAYLLDSTGLGFPEQVAAILRVVRSRLPQL